MSTNSKIERAAQRLLDSSDITTPPVPVNVIAAERSLAVVFDDLGDDVSGMLYRRSGIEIMVINETHPHHRQRFSIAHEIGHAELHDSDTYLDGLASLRFRDGKSATGTDLEEREANQFAAALLMPANWVHEAFVAMATTGGPFDETEAVRTLASDFDVSELSMRYRLINLGLVDPA